MESGIAIGMTPKRQVDVLNAKPPVFVIGLPQTAVLGPRALGALKQSLTVTTCMYLWLALGLTAPSSIGS